MNLDIECWKRGGCPLCGNANRGKTNYTCSGCAANNFSGFEAAMKAIDELPPMVTSTVPVTPKRNCPIYVLERATGDRLFTFLCHLRPDDQPVAVQREYLEVVRALKKEMGGGK